MLGKALTTAAAGSAAGGGEYIEDLFSTYLYTGNGSTQTITNGIDLAGEGGLVWIKGRTGSSGYIEHALFDTNRGVSNGYLRTNTTNAATGTNAVNFAFASTGFSFNSDGYIINDSSIPSTYASWTFRKAEKFFDVVTYTGTGVSDRLISHNLGSTPGCIIVKRLTASGYAPDDAWGVYHRSLGVYASDATNNLFLNTTAAASSSGLFRENGITSTTFEVSADPVVNASGVTYVAYLFAHDAGGFGDSGDESVIKCGSYTANATSQEINLGWEPQWILLKNADRVVDWSIFDTMRGIVTGGAPDNQLKPNTSAAEFGQGGIIEVTSTGFRVLGSSGFTNGASGEDFIYIAIRRGPMKTPTDATEVFNSVTYTGDGATGRIITTNILTDLFINCRRTGAQNVGIGYSAHDRIRGDGGRLTTYSTTAESSSSVAPKFDLMDGIDLDGFNGGAYNASSAPYILHAFRRAPGFFDVVAYTGNGVNNRSIPHNLTVTPELVIYKSRSNAESWFITHSSFAVDQYLFFTAGSLRTFPNSFGLPTSTNLVVGNGAGVVNGSGGTYIAYLFATLPGISKVGSYTGTGTTLNIDCGFAAGARFVLIKRADSTGDWYVWDTVRGIVNGDDPYLLLNSELAEVTSTDYIDPLASGFQISGSAPAAINASGGSYIFLAIA